MRPPANFECNRHLSEFTTLGIGGPAKYFVEIRRIQEMQDALKFCHAHQLPYFILGKGSNTLFDDKGFNGVVIGNRIDFFESPSEGCFHVGAGYSFSLLGSQTARLGWSGLEFASGIPASVGGAVYMNAGANGRETCDFLESVDFMTEEGEFIHLLRSDIEFKYRFSSFHLLQGAIVAATFRLISSPSARAKQLESIQYRKHTQPYGSKSAGCIFRNPSNRYAAALIDQAGLKGKMVGEAQVSPIHANFLVNTGNATSTDFSELIALIKQEIKDQTGIELECEVRRIAYEPIMHKKDLHE